MSQQTGIIKGLERNSVIECRLDDLNHVSNQTRILPNLGDMLVCHGAINMQGHESDFIFSQIYIHLIPD
ncbi:hypothetical protein D3C75_1243330 [compost metagenome]